MKSLDKILENATYFRSDEIYKERKDNIKRFHYYDTKINGKNCRLNVAETEITEGDRIRYRRFLYSVTKIQ